MSDNYDFCEYVYNPLMEQYRSMMRLMSMLRDSQSDCNDVECFTTNQVNSASNPMGLIPNAPTTSSFPNFLVLFLIWAFFVFALFMLRPTTMRQSNKNADANKPKRRDFSDNRDDDNDFTAS